MSRQVFLLLLAGCASYPKAPLEHIVNLPAGESGCAPLRFTELAGHERLRIACESGREYFGDVADKAIRWERTGERPPSLPSRAIFAPRGAYWLELSADRRTLSLVELPSGERHDLYAPTANLLEEISDPWISEDGRRVLYVVHYLSGKGDFAVFVGDPAAKTFAHLLRSETRLSKPSLAADGRRLAWHRGGRLWMVETRPRRTGESSWLGAVGPQMPVEGGAPADETETWSPEFDGFVSVLRRDGKDSLFFVEAPAAAAAKPRPCARRITPPSRETLRSVRLSRGSAFLAYARGRQILVSPFSGSRAPCEGPALGVE